mmetsp:Transcript_31480/g.45865  ORF Transcript_31480/g.45865 Transcript_31480/m.45865 type:complete len:197 (+) Transcript_31480:1130-1720(+)
MFRASISTVGSHCLSQGHGCAWSAIYHGEDEACSQLTFTSTHTHANGTLHCKTKAIAFTAYALKDCTDNGGDGIKLGLFRAQSYKVAKRMVRQRVRQRDGSFRATGEIIRQKGDLFLVDYAVNGSEEGAYDNPKFSLKQLFETTIFPDVEKLVGPGGKYEGHKVIFQGDNAGPHRELPIVVKRDGIGNRKLCKCRT